MALFPTQKATWEKLQKLDEAALAKEKKEEIIVEDLV